MLVQIMRPDRLLVGDGVGWCRRGEACDPDAKSTPRPLGSKAALNSARSAKRVIAGTVRGILDGHMVLSRALAHQNHYLAL